MTGHGGGYKHGRLGRCKLKLTIKAGDDRFPEEHNALGGRLQLVPPGPSCGVLAHGCGMHMDFKNGPGGRFTSRAREILNGVTSHKVQRYSAVAVKSGFVNSLLTRLSMCEPSGLLPHMYRILRPFDGLDEAIGVNTGRPLKVDPGSNLFQGGRGDRDLFRGR